MPRMRKPGLSGVLFRVVFIAFLMTLLTFALTLLGSILTLAVVGEFRGGLAHVNMAVAYRHIAFPVAITIGSIVLVAAFVYEMRRYLRMRALARLEEKL
ncbi:MAG TPA: hypothetical protein VE994_14740 [Terriglobales bacterium]|nr:hypothetical protein [Terriglobales bacterium]